MFSSTFIVWYMRMPMYDYLAQKAKINMRGVISDY